MQTQLTADEQSKDEFFQQLATLSEDMVAKHGKDFSMGALVLAARWIAENRIGESRDGKATSN
ncbi:hypothetical protein [Aminobacter aminovorans]|jgi:hypothetical protein|uniref:Uncharacterized protein n=1 Tax=Aminobacter aminovorans TaxID=83263 RepID=A0AAC8YVV1_AMIAI|nr:hypothetical protein [Aminobacter aminovorans]AMS45128.1 hypothetical protein AA2016_6227 [Aminobacter aminovorans]MBB3705117.1 hypothetical protein [Aminobacter aminovorans]